jgi:hypothetical protein
MEPPSDPQSVADKVCVFGEWKVTLHEKGHKYTVVSLTTGSPVVGQIDSATQFSSSLFPKFNANLILGRYKSKGFAAKFGPAATKPMVKAYWEENAKYSAMLGTRMHSVIEGILKKYMEMPPPREYVLPDTLPLPIEGPPFPDIQVVPLYKTGSTIVVRPHLVQLVDYLRANHLEPIAVEKCLFSPRLLLCGTMDALFRDTTTNDLYIFDWKRRDEFTTVHEYNEQGIKGTPMEGKQYSHYESAVLQLNLYRYMLKDGEQRVIKGMRIVSIHPHLANILVNDIPIDEPLTQALVEYRLKTMTK